MSLGGSTTLEDMMINMALNVKCQVNTPINGSLKVHSGTLCNVHIMFQVSQLLMPGPMDDTFSITTPKGKTPHGEDSVTPRTRLMGMLGGCTPLSDSTPSSTTPVSECKKYVFTLIHSINKAIHTQSHVNTVVNINVQYFLCILRATSNYIV